MINPEFATPEKVLQEPFLPSPKEGRERWSVGRVTGSAGKLGLAFICMGFVGGVAAVGGILGAGALMGMSPEALMNSRVIELQASGKMFPLEISLLTSELMGMFAGVKIAARFNRG